MPGAFFEYNNMDWLSHTAPAASCLGASGTARSVARRIGVGHCTPRAAVRSHAHEVARRDTEIGKVHSGGPWSRPAVHAQLAAALGAPLAAALRADFEWYVCRGAFYHNDAHYDARLFGIWCIQAPPIDLVFSRVGVRVPLRRGTFVVFDPFEVHGVLGSCRSVYTATDYREMDSAVFLGFELDITAETARACDIGYDLEGPVISSRTRICASSGAIEFS